MNLNLQYLACAIQILTLAICNAYWSQQRDIWTRDRSTKPAPSELYLIQSDWRHQHDPDTELQTTT